MEEKMGVAEQKLKDCIMEQHRSVRAFAMSLGLPCSTVNNVLRRGVGSINLSTAAVLCSSLGLDAAAFVDGEVKPAVVGAAEPWEQELLESSRQLDMHSRELVIMVVRKELERVGGNRVEFPTDKRESWKQYLGAPIACRGGGVIAATEEDARQMDRIYRGLMIDKGRYED